MNVMLNPQPFTFIGNLLNAVQIPNAQGCAAFKGETFKITTGEEQQLGDDKVNFDACSVQMDAFASKFAKMPMMKKAPMKDMFDENCYELTADRLGFLDGFGDVGGLLKSLVEGKCVNFANGYSGSCTYKASSTSTVGPNAKSDSDNSDNNTSQDNDKKKDPNSGSIASASMFSFMLVTFIASMMF